MGNTGGSIHIMLQRVNIRNVGAKSNGDMVEHDILNLSRSFALTHKQCLVP